MTSLFFSIDLHTYSVLVSFCFFFVTITQYCNLKSNIVIPQLSFSGLGWLSRVFCAFHTMTQVGLELTVYVSQANLEVKSGFLLCLPVCWDCRHKLSILHLCVSLPCTTEECDLLRTNVDTGWYH